jgi:hypothetical protein
MKATAATLAGSDARFDAPSAWLRQRFQRAKDRLKRLAKAERLLDPGRPAQRLVGVL